MESIKLLLLYRPGTPYLPHSLDLHAKRQILCNFKGNLIRL